MSGTTGAAVSASRRMADRKPIRAPARSVVGNTGFGLRTDGQRRGAAARPFSDGRLHGMQESGAHGAARPFAFCFCFRGTVC